MGDVDALVERWCDIHTDESYGVQGRNLGILAREIIALRARRRSAINEAIARALEAAADTCAKEKRRHRENARWHRIHQDHKAEVAFALDAENEERQEQRLRALAARYRTNERLRGETRRPTARTTMPDLRDRIREALIRELNPTCPVEKFERAVDAVVREATRDRAADYADCYATHIAPAGAAAKLKPQVSD